MVFHQMEITKNDVSGEVWKPCCVKSLAGLSCDVGDCHIGVAEECSLLLCCAVVFGE